MPGTKCDARSDASKQGARIGASPNRCQAPGATPGDASKQEAQTGARHQVRRQVDASKQGAQIGARHQVRRQVDASKQEAQTGARRC